MLGWILLLLGFAGFLFFLYLGEDRDEIMYKAADESCYYCIYSATPHTIRDRSKNTCQKIDNTGWSSEQIRHCKYRIKE